MFNFTVEDYHTYFVAESPGNCLPILAHNETVCGTHSELKKARKNGTIEFGKEDEINHLNMDSIFGTRKGGKIPYGQGAANILKGSATDANSEHGKFHRSMENWLDQFRKGGARYKQKPTVSEYLQEMQEALKHAGKSDREAFELMESARRNLDSYGYSPDKVLPRIPDKWRWD